MGSEAHAARWQRFLELLRSGRSHLGVDQIDFFKSRQVFEDVESCISDSCGAEAKVPQKQPKRRRLWCNDGSCVRLRPAHQDHVWGYDFVQARTHDGRAFRMLTIVDEFTRECLAIDVARKLSSEDVLERLSDLFIRRGVPDYLRSDNGPEFTAKRVKDWLERVEVKTLFIEPGSPWENGYVESFNGKLRDELLNGEIFDPLLEAKVLIERWRVEYNTIRPHSALGYRPPAPEAIQPWKSNLATLGWTSRAEKTEELT